MARFWRDLAWTDLAQPDPAFTAVGLPAVAAGRPGLCSGRRLSVPSEDQHGVYGGAPETFQMMWLRSDLVLADHSAEFTMTMALAAEYQHLWAMGIGCTGGGGGMLPARPSRGCGLMGSR